MTSIELLQSWLARRLPDTAHQWLEAQLAELRDSYTDRRLHITLGMIPRRLGKADLAPDALEFESAQAARPGWDPRAWSIADAARALVLLQSAGAGNVSFAERFIDLCRSADVAESIALYRALPLYPEPKALEPQAGEGLRTNMRTVFEAVAHHNPYPREVFDQDRWNHMVLKALFVDSRLDPIQGLDERANPELARIMCDYAHERWAAGRQITPEIWRCVGPFAQGSMVDDLARVYGSDDTNEARAAALALTASPDTRAAAVLDSRPELADSARKGAFGWSDIAAALD